MNKAFISRAYSMRFTAALVTTCPSRPVMALHPISCTCNSQEPNHVQGPCTAGPI